MNKQIGDVKVQKLGAFHIIIYPIARDYFMEKSDFLSQNYVKSFGYISFRILNAYKCIFIFINVQVDCSRMLRVCIITGMFTYILLFEWCLK